MSLLRRNARRDTAERDIITALRKAGFSVEQWSAKDRPDLIVGRWGITRLIEVKTGRGKLSAGQAEWWANWRGNPVLVLTCAEAIPTLVTYWLQGHALHAALQRLTAPSDPR